MDKTSTYKNEMGACHSMPLDFETKYVGPSSCRLPKLSSSVLDPMKKVYHSEEIYAQVFAIRKWEHAWHTMGCKQGPQPTNQPTQPTNQAQVDAHDFKTLNVEIVFSTTKKCKIKEPSSWQIPKSSTVACFRRGMLGAGASRVSFNSWEMRRLRFPLGGQRVLARKPNLGAISGFLSCAGLWGIAFSGDSWAVHFPWYARSA